MSMLTIAGGILLAYVIGYALLACMGLLLNLEFSSGSTDPRESDYVPAAPRKTWIHWGQIAFVLLGLVIVSFLFFIC